MEWIVGWVVAADCIAAVDVGADGIVGAVVDLVVAGCDDDDLDLKGEVLNDESDAEVVERDGGVVGEQGVCWKDVDEVLLV